MQKDTRKQIKRFSHLAFVLIIFSIFTMILGPLVRAEDAGLACPDWPLCKGKVIPVMDYQVFLEWLHRVVAACLSIVFLFWAAFTFLVGQLRKRYAALVSLALVLLCLQISLGALTITETLDAYIVSSHLLNAVIFLAVLTYCWYKSRYDLGYGLEEKPQWQAREAWLTRLVSCLSLIFIFVQLFLGARVSSHQAGRVCNSFPACYYKTVIDQQQKDNVRQVPEYFPLMIGSLEKHMTHRFMAYFLFIWFTFSIGLAAMKKWPMLSLRYLWALLLLLVMQIGLGAFNVIYSLPTSITVLHSTFAYILFLLAFLFFLETCFADNS